MLAEDLHDVFDAMPDAVFVADPASLRITYANAMARALTGQPLERLAALTLCDLYPSVTHSLMRRQIVRLRSATAPLVLRTNLEPPGTAPIAAEISLSLARIDGTALLICTARDFRQQQQTEQLLRASTALYRMLIEATSDLVFRLTRDGTYLDYHVPPDSGLPVPVPESIIGRNVANVMPPHVAEIALPAIRRAVDTGTVQLVEYPVREPDGLHHYQARFVPSQADEVVAVVRDITDRIREIELLQQSESTARALLNASGDAAVLLDRDWTVLAANDTMAHWLQQRVEDLLGRNIFSFLPPQIGQTRRAYAEIMLQTRQPISFEDERDGRILSHRVHPIFDAQGEVRFIAVFARDITERRHTDALVARQRALLQAVAKAASLLLAPGDLDTAIKGVLALLGETAVAHAISIYVNHPHPVTGEPAISPRYYWLQPGIVDRPLDPRLVNAVWTPERIAAFYSVLAQNQVIQATRASVPADLRELMEVMEIQALMLVPVFAGSELWGVMTFNDLLAERHWNAEEVNALQTMAASLGNAIQHERHEAELRQKREAAERLRQFGNAISGIYNPDQILQRLLDELRQVISCEAASGMILDGDILRIVASLGYERFGISRHQLMRKAYRLAQMPLLQGMLSTHQPLILKDVRSEPAWLNAPGGEWIRGWLGAPIVSGDKVRGFITLDSSHPNRFTEQDVGWLEAFAAQTAIALENAWYVVNIQRLEQIKSEMIRIASHDLRSPLARAQMLVQRLLDNLAPTLTPAHVKSLEQALDATHDVEHIITEILSLERIEAQHRSAQPIYWCELIEQATQALAGELAQSGHTLRIDCPATLPVTRGNPLKLERVVYNLVHNAVKYTPPGGTISVRAFEKPYGPERVLAVEVSDTGIGIPPDALPNLFQPFQRFEQSGAEEVPGLGLGLAMVKAIVQEHHGQVYVDSTPGQGSIFGFWVPIPDRS